jgi:hypothetical protein
MDTWLICIAPSRIGGRRRDHLDVDVGRIPNVLPPNLHARHQPLPRPNVQRVREYPQAGRGLSSIQGVLEHGGLVSQAPPSYTPSPLLSIAFSILFCSTPSRTMPYGNFAPRKAKVAKKSTTWTPDTIHHPIFAPARPYAPQSASLHRH